MKGFGCTVMQSADPYDYNGMFVRENYAVDEYRHITALFLK
jgi:hypothetical protein